MLTHNGGFNCDSAQVLVLELERDDPIRDEPFRLR